MILAALLLSMQVGPDPMGVQLEPLPIPRAQQQQQESPPAPDSAQRELVEAAVAAAISGNEAILAGDYAGALALFESAQVQALAAGRNTLAAEVGLDRARALVLLGRYAQAEGILSEVRLRKPDNAEGWRASALVARNLDKLDEAQGFIARAAELAPADPAVGLEAGAIAFYAGDTAAAHRSWQSVIDLAPEGEEAALARTYIAQTGESPAQPSSPED